MLHGYFDIPTFTFFDEKNVWSGSMYRNFNYRIEPIKAKPDDSAKSELHLIIWYGNKCIDKAENIHAHFHKDFSPQGLDECIQILNDEFEKFKQIRKNL